MEITLGAIYDRLLYLKRIESKNDFAEKLGYDRSYISRVISENGQIPHKLLQKIHEAFPGIEDELSDKTETPMNDLLKLLITTNAELVKTNQKLAESNQELVHMLRADRAGYAPKMAAG